eukprot:sb/3477402/
MRYMEQSPPITEQPTYVDLLYNQPSPVPQACGTSLSLILSPLFSLPHSLSLFLSPSFSLSLVSPSFSLPRSLSRILSPSFSFSFYVIIVRNLLNGGLAPRARESDPKN